MTQVQDPAIGLVEPHALGFSPSVCPVLISLWSLSIFWQINSPTQLGVICKLTEEAFDLLIQIIDTNI